MAGCLIVCPLVAALQRAAGERLGHCRHCNQFEQIAILMRTLHIDTKVQIQIQIQIQHTDKISQFGDAQFMRRSLAISRYCHNIVTILLQYHQNIITISSENHKNIITILSQYYHNIITILLHHYQITMYTAK